MDNKNTEERQQVMMDLYCDSGGEPVCGDFTEWCPEHDRVCLSPVLAAALDQVAFLEDQRPAIGGNV